MNTGNKQHPREFGTYENSMKLSDLSKPGVPLARFPVLFDSRRGEPLLLAQNGSLFANESANGGRSSALQQHGAAGRILPGQTGSAFEDLRALQELFEPGALRRGAKSVEGRA